MIIWRDELLYAFSEILYTVLSYCLLSKTKFFFSLSCTGDANAKDDGGWNGGGGGRQTGGGRGGRGRHQADQGESGRPGEHQGQIPITQPQGRRNG